MSLEINPAMHPSYPRLPHDIQLLIVDEAASDSALRSVVKALALTHHALREPCQRYLFSEVPYERCVSLLKILKCSPQIADYIRTLTIPTHLLLILKKAARGVEFLSKLRCIRNLRILKQQPWLQDFSWREVHPQLTTELLRLMHSPVLRSLEICNTDKFPLQDFLLLGRSPNLTSLKIAKLRVVVVEPEEDRMLRNSERCSEGPLHNPPTLRKLSIGLGSRDVLKIILGTTLDFPSHGCPLFDLIYLRRLSVVWWGAKDSQAERLLIESSSAVEDLEVVLGPKIRSFKGLSSAILQGSGQVLKKLTLLQKGDFYSWKILLKKHLFGILKEMHVLSGNMDTLSTIVIQLAVEVDDYDESMRALQEVSKQCREFDKVLADHKNFPALRKVRFSIVFNISEVPESTDEENPQQIHKKFTIKKVGAYTQQFFAKLNTASPAIDVEVDVVDNYRNGTY